MPQGKVVWIRRNHPQDDNQLHPDKARIVQSRVIECNSNYFRFRVNAMNLPHAAPRDQIPQCNPITYIRHRNRSNELMLISEQLSIAPWDTTLSGEH